MNKIIKLLIISDIFVITGFGLIGPILAIFIRELPGSSLFAVGFSSTLFLIVKSIVQLPLSRYVDKHDHKKRLLIAGTIMMAFVPFMYIAASHIYHVYAIQVWQGIGSALAFPTFLSLFSTNLDKKKEGFEWSIYSTLVGLGTAGSAALGAKIAEIYDFRVTFAIVGIMAMLGCLVLFFLQSSAEKDRKMPIIYKSKVLGHRHGQH